MHRAGTAANNETLTLLAGALGLARALLRQRMPILPLGHIQPPPAPNLPPRRGIAHPFRPAFPLVRAWSANGLLPAPTLALNVTHQ